jgi:ubiquinone/menaquinone biosynthesis C-methylase UbiE
MADQVLNQDFEGVARTLREEVLAYYERRGEPAPAGTLETNSGFTERRGRPLLTMLAPRLPSGSLRGLRLLDLGCGFGSLSAFFAAQGASVTALDPNESRLQVGASVARRHGLDARFRVGRMQDLDLPPSAFDVALMNNSLCYVVQEPERRRALGEAARVLAAGGTLIMRNPNRWHPRDQFTGLPLVHLLPPAAAVSASSRLGHARSLCVVPSPVRTRRELRAAGFDEITQHGFVDSRRPDLLRLVARYHHFSARRPGP